MTDAQRRCPDENQLQRFALGGREDELPAIEAHLDACETCRRAVAAAASSQTLPATLPSAELKPGMRVARYEIERELGRGGMGVVYLARDVTLDRRIALKLLHARHDEAAQARLLREAQVMARLAHPNAVPVFELGDWRGELYLTMELVNGQTLDAWLKAAPRSTAEILEKFTEAGRGLAAAHAAGVVHRDFKPANVLVGLDGRVRVTDFGLSRPGPAVALPPMASPLVTRDGALVGTLAYMAPEQLDGKTADEQSDQFSFCVALAEALLGTRPFEGENWSTLARAHAEPPKLARTLPTQVRKVLQRGLSREPTRRFVSMVALLDALRVSPHTRTTRWLAALSAAGLALGLAATTVLRNAGASSSDAMRPVITAASDLAPDTVVTMDMLVQRNMPARYVTSSVVPVDAVNTILGLKLIAPLQKGDPLLWSQFEVAKEGVRVLVAADELAEGTVITRDLLQERIIDPALATRSVVRAASAEVLLGARVRVPAEKGALVLWTQFEPRVQHPTGPGVMAVVAAHKREIASCVEAELNARPTSVRRKVLMGWQINLDGSVSNVAPLTPEFVDSSIARCFSTAISSWRFAPTHEVEEVQFPIAF